MTARGTQNLSILIALSAAALTGCDSADRPTSPVPNPTIHARGALEVVDLTPRVRMTATSVLAALTDSSASDGTVLIGVKEAGASRGVGTDGSMPRLATRLAAAAAIVSDFPSAHVLNGVVRHVPDGVRQGLPSDSIDVPFIRVRMPIDSATVARLLAHPNVDYVEPNLILSVDLAGGFHGRDVVRASSVGRMAGEIRSWGIDTVRAPGQWSLGWTGKGVTVAILDGGADLYGSGGTPHPDFATANWIFSNNVVAATPPNACTSGASQPGCYWEGPFHGTGVAGLFVGQQNGAASVGTAPHGGPADTGSVLIQKLAYLNASGATVTDLNTYAQTVSGINANSLVRVALTEVTYPAGTSASLNTLHDQFIAAFSGNRVLWLAPAGNNGPTNNTVNYPGAWPEVVAIGALYVSGGALVRSVLSPINSEVELVAPGEGLALSWNRSDPENIAAGFVDISYKSGTSFAAPIAAGVARLALQKFPGWTASQLRQAMFNSARPLGVPGRDNTFGYGMVDAFCLLNQWNPCETYVVGASGPSLVTAKGTYALTGSASHASSSWQWERSDNNGTTWYSWSNAQNTTVTVTALGDYYIKFRLTAMRASDGRSSTALHDVHVCSTTNPNCLN